MWIKSEKILGVVTRKKFKVAKIDNAKFKRKVVPGDVLVMRLKITEPLRRTLMCMHGEAYVGNHLACECDMMAQIIKNKE